MVSVDYFHHELIARMARADRFGQISILINSADFHRSLGGYPGSTHGLGACCDAMQTEMTVGDVLLVERTNDAGMTVRYLLPRGGLSDGVESGGRGAPL